MAEDSPEDEEADGPAPLPEPYVFDASQVSEAVALLDAACVDLQHGYATATRLIELAGARGLGDSPLMWELVHAVGHDLQRELGGRPGCSLGRDIDEGLLRWPRPIANAPADALQLWETAAGTATAPAAIARLEDLLFERRVGNGLQRARRAATSYLAAVDAAAEFGMDEVDALLRAWTLARSVKEGAVDADVRHRMAQISAAVMKEAPGARPGVVLPLLQALAQGPVIDPDPHDVDGLLTRAASVFRKGYLAEQIAADRRGRAAGDPVLLEQIARDEVAGYFAEADDSPNAAVRMHHLNAAARVAKDRGLTDVAREASVQMQRIRPSELGMQHIRVESNLPRYVPESYIARFTHGSSWRDGLAYFFASDVPSGALDQVRSIGSNSRGTLASLFPTTLFGAGGLPRVTAAAEEAHGMSQAASMCARFYGQMFAIGLDRVVDRYGVPPFDELVDAIVGHGCRDPQLARGLARGFEHYFKGDFESCAAVVIPKFEAAARSLLRELDEGIYRVQVGNDPGGYVGLYILVDELEKLALDESWTYFFRWLLLGPYGANLRNDVAHGFVFDTGPVYTALLLRAVSVLVLVAARLRPTSTSRRPAPTRWTCDRGRWCSMRWPTPSGPTRSGASSQRQRTCWNGPCGGCGPVPYAAARAGGNAAERARLARWSITGSCDAVRMDMEHLRFEHPTLAVQTAVIVDAPQRARAGGGGARRKVWGHHLEFAERTNALAGHRILNAVAHRVLQIDGAVAPRGLTTVDGREFCVGDDMIARRPNRALHPRGQPANYGRNGSRGQVVAIEPPSRSRCRRGSPPSTPGG